VLPALRPVRAREIWASLAGYAIVLALMSWPLLSNPARLGVVNQDDGRLNVWILGWVAHSLVTDPASLDALMDAKAYQALVESEAR